MPRRSSEDSIMYALVAIIGAIPVAIALATHAVFGVDATVGALMVLIGVGGLCSAR